MRAARPYGLPDRDRIKVGRAAGGCFTGWMTQVLVAIVIAVGGRGRRSYEDTQDAGDNTRRGTTVSFVANSSSEWPHA